MLKWRSTFKVVKRRIDWYNWWLDNQQERLDVNEGGNKTENNKCLCAMRGRVPRRRLGDRGMAVAHSHAKTMPWEHNGRSAITSDAFNNGRFYIWTRNFVANFVSISHDFRQSTVVPYQRSRHRHPLRFIGRCLDFFCFAMTNELSALFSTQLSSARRPRFVNDLTYFHNKRALIRRFYNSGTAPTLPLRPVPLSVIFICRICRSVYIFKNHGRLSQETCFCVFL